MSSLPSKHHSVYNGGPPSASAQFSPPSFSSYPPYHPLQSWLPAASHHPAHWQGSSFPPSFVLRPEKAAQAASGTGGVQPHFGSPETTLRPSNNQSYSLSASSHVLSPPADGQLASVSKRATPKQEPQQSVFVPGPHSNGNFPSSSNSVPDAARSHFLPQATEAQGRDVAAPGSGSREALQEGKDHAVRGVSEAPGVASQLRGPPAAAEGDAGCERPSRQVDSPVRVPLKGDGEQTPSSRGMPRESPGSSSVLPAVGLTAVARGMLPCAPPASPPSAASSSAEELLDILFPSFEASCGHVTAPPQPSTLSFSPPRTLLHPSAARMCQLARPAPALVGVKGSSSPAFQQLKCGLEVIQLDQKQLWSRWTKSRRRSLGIPHSSSIDFRKRRPGQYGRSKAGSLGRTDGAERGGTTLGLHADGAAAAAAASAEQLKHTPTGKGSPGSVLRSWDRFKRRCLSEYVHPADGSSRHRFAEELQEQVYLFRQFAGVFAASDRRSGKSFLLTTTWPRVRMNSPTECEVRTNTSGGHSSRCLVEMRAHEESAEAVPNAAALSVADFLDCSGTVERIAEPFLGADSIVGGRTRLLLVTPCVARASGLCVGVLNGLACILARWA